MWNKKMDLLRALYEKILNACKMDDVMKEVEANDFLKMQMRPSTGF